MRLCLNLWLNHYHYQNYLFLKNYNNILDEREERKKEHKLEMEERLKKIKTLKDSLKDKLNFHSK